MLDTDIQIALSIFQDAVAHVPDAELDADEKEEACEMLNSLAAIAHTTRRLDHIARLGMMPN
jgi:hypothetical protein